MARESWHEYFMKIAQEVSTRATCDRLKVGAVIVKDHRILTTGYNGSLPGTPHCDEAGHIVKDGHCVRTIHAEANAVLQAAKFGISLDGATCYVTFKPCLNCLKILLGSGVQKIIYREIYGNEKSYFGEAELLDGLNPFQSLDDALAEEKAARAACHKEAGNE
ncbi:MAG: dCMP deaminase family protein [Candidatus Lernaella stagnicola]|nr:dCMP deaminase family protein [Candidatus Lernaella stagnicola]